MVEGSEKHVLFRQAAPVAAESGNAFQAYQQQLFLAIAYYSAGEPLDVVRQATAKAVALLAAAPDQASIPLLDAEHYYTALWGLSLSMLFGDATPVFEQRFAGQDSLFDRLLQRTGSQLEPITICLHPKPFLTLLAVLDDPSTADNSIQTFLITWYAGMGQTRWHDTHLRMDPAFFGYWSFELAAVVKAWNINDATFSENIFYPRDLVHQRLYRTWLDDAQGEEERKAAAGRIAQRDLEIAKNALSVFFAGGTVSQEGGESLANGMKMLATVLGMEQEALQKNPALLRAGLMQIMQSALNLSKSTLTQTENPGTAGLGPVMETLQEIATKATAAEQGLDATSQLLADTGGNATLNPQERLLQARERLETINSTLSGLLKDEQGQQGVFGGLEKLMHDFATTLGIIPPKPRDIRTEVADEVSASLAEANRKNMIGDDFNWSSLWKKDQ